jgi:NH3-dependent NAD+ synthetase
LQRHFPDSTINVEKPRGGNIDQFRWADLHYRAAENRYWVASTVNATEKALGTYSILNKSASIMPIASIYKSEVLDLCMEYMVPHEVVRRSQIPDCICGRDEFAAENIDLIDCVLRNKILGDFSGDDIRKAMDYIRQKKAEGGFKDRTPYTV